MNLKQTNNIKSIQETKGGEVIAAGGFGCVFDPALVCKKKSKKIQPRKNRKYISKLMTKKHALEEYHEIINIRNQLKNIPHYTNYFLINDFTLCKPNNLTRKDLKHFEKKCTTLKKQNIDSKNINQHLEQLLALNMPYGGLPVDDYIYKNITYSKLIQLNNSLIHLLHHGIIPMNQKNIYHNDIKDSNILVETGKKKFKTRLIDWGLSCEYIPFQNQTIPYVWVNRPFQYNVPFSIVLFSNDFMESYTRYLDEGKLPNHNELKPFLYSYISFWLTKTGQGHYQYINRIFFMLFNQQSTSLNKDQTEKLTLSYIIEYLAAILIQFTEKEHDTVLMFHFRNYLDKVFIQLVDIWGFLVSYLPLLEILFENFDKLKETEKHIFESLKQLFLKYLFQSRVKPILVDELIKDLKNLNHSFSILNKKFKKKSESLKSSLGNHSKGVTGYTYVLSSTSKRVKSTTSKKTRRNSSLFSTTHTHFTK